jgi:hypothetical protein
MAVAGQIYFYYAVHFQYVTDVRVSVEVTLTEGIMALSLPPSTPTQLWNDVFNNVAVLQDW